MTTRGSIFENRRLELYARQRKFRGGANSVHIVRVRNRVYNNAGRLVSHSEYAVVDGDRVLARLLLNRRSWVAIVPGKRNSFGKPVSPVNLVRLRDVKSWALTRWAKEQ